MSMLSISVDDVAGIIRAQVGDKLPADVALGPDAVLEDLELSSVDLTEVFVSIEELSERELDASRSRTHTCGASGTGRACGASAAHAPPCARADDASSPAHR